MVLVILTVIGMLVVAGIVYVEWPRGGKPREKTAERREFEAWHADCVKARLEGDGVSIRSRKDGGK